MLTGQVGIVIIYIVLYLSLLCRHMTSFPIKVIVHSYVYNYSQQLKVKYTWVDFIPFVILIIVNNFGMIAAVTRSRQSLPFPNITRSHIYADQIQKYYVLPVKHKEHWYKWCKWAKQTHPPQTERKITLERVR